LHQKESAGNGTKLRVKTKNHAQILGGAKVADDLLNIAINLAPKTKKQNCINYKLHKPNNHILCGHYIFLLKMWQAI